MSGRIEYFRPGEATRGVCWCVHVPGREPVWTRQLCAAIRLSRMRPGKVKPVALYRWLLKNYAKPGQRILDTHLGSGSIAIACDIEGFDLVGCELDLDYITAARKRLADHQAQPRLFASEKVETGEQGAMF